MNSKPTLLEQFPEIFHLPRGLMSYHLATYVPGRSESNVITPSVHSKDWGEELWMVNNPGETGYCFKILKIRSRWSSSIHFHLKKDECFYVKSGLVLLEISKTSQWSEELVHSIILKPNQNQWIRICPNQAHRFVAIFPSVIWEVSSTHRDEDVIRLAKSTRLSFGQLLRGVFRRKFENY